MVCLSRDKKIDITGREKSIKIRNPKRGLVLLIFGQCNALMLCTFLLLLFFN